MKKLMVKYVIFLLGLIGIAIVNNVVMLKFHPLEFYYTPTGMLISIIVMGIESLFLFPACWWYIKKYILVMPEESTKKES